MQFLDGICLDQQTNELPKTLEVTKLGLYVII